MNIDKIANLITEDPDIFNEDPIGPDWDEVEEHLPLPGNSHTPVFRAHGAAGIGLTKNLKNSDTLNPGRPDLIDEDDPDDDEIDEDLLDEEGDIPKTGGADDPYLNASQKEMLTWNMEKAASPHSTSRTMAQSLGTSNFEAPIPYKTGRGISP